MKTGTRIEVSGITTEWQETWEPARITRKMAYMHPIPEGYHPVKFAADGARLMVHETNFRVVDNR